MKTLAAIFVLACAAGIQAGTYLDRFTEQYKKIHNAANGYFSSDGVPYHSVETLVVEAPDHGHQTTSEAYSYYVWLEAMQGAVTGDFSSFNAAWENLETYIIPKLQPHMDNYNPSKPATYSDELDDPSQYPSPQQPGVPVGQDPIYQELKSAYGQDFVYSMHWLLDVDNVYGFGNTQAMCEEGPQETGPSLINNYQRGPNESVWKTVPQPTCDIFKYGGSHGFLDLFVGDNSYTQQWKYSNAPDADARAIQAAFWASRWAAAKGKTADVSATLSKASKMGDFLRYALFDKYFKRIGNCIGPYNCQGGSGKDSAHYLISWYFAWGAALYGGWGWMIGDGAAHFGYQNPLAAYALSHEESLKPKGATSVDDWTNSLARQLELYEYLQTAEGAFAGGVTNTWKGRYDQPTANLTSNTFHGMFYDWEPVYHDPPSNRWYGMQPWSTDRLAQYYYVTGDSKAEALLKKWVPWAIANIKFEKDDFQIPDQLSWTGVPPSVDVHIDTYGQDIGAASATARALSYYAAKAKDSEAQAVAKKLLDALYKYATPLGITIDELRPDYNRFNDPVYIPSGWTGKYPNGDVIDSSATFIKLRSWYKNDPQWPKVQAYLDGGEVPTFQYHRFWAQADVAISFGTYGLLFES